MSCQMVDPSLFSQLCHNRIDERITSFAVFPGLKEGLILIPLDLLADWIAFDLIEVGSEGSVKIEELSPDQLSLERNWRKRVLADLFVDFLDAMIEESAAEVAELEVWTQYGCRWID